ncbi:cell wall adhesin EAP1-like [Asterias rubens]|uniref:cell wall adhesin EAP1-like n=1 Tax=Asterias rubens TaxID=7604 RepID=UPI00145541FD|nr:cell wall adhesin EAP1-like [Asterias rubens]
MGQTIPTTLYFVFFAILTGGSWTSWHVASAATTQGTTTDSATTQWVTTDSATTQGATTDPATTTQGTTTDPVTTEVATASQTTHDATTVPATTDDATTGYVTTHETTPNTQLETTSDSVTNHETTSVTHETASVTPKVTTPVTLATTSTPPALATIILGVILALMFLIVIIAMVLLWHRGTLPSWMTRSRSRSPSDVEMQKTAPGSRSPASTPLVQSGEDSEYAEVNPIDLKTAAQDDDIHVYSNIEVNQQNPRGVQRYVPHKKGPTPGVSNQPPGGSDHTDPSDVEMQKQAPGSRSPASTPLVQSGEDSEYAEVNPIDLKTAAQDDDIHVYSNIEVNQQNPRGVQRYVPHKKGPTPGVSNQPPGGSDHKDPSDVEMQTSAPDSQLPASNTSVYSNIEVNQQQQGGVPRSVAHKKRPSPRVPSQPAAGSDRKPPKLPTKRTVQQDLDLYVIPDVKIG